MKPRDMFLIILAVGITGGLVWWMWQPSAKDIANAKAAADTKAANASGAAGSTMTGTAKSADSASRNADANNTSTKSANDTADASSTDTTARTDGSSATSAATNPGNDPAANGKGTKPASAKGLHYVAGPDGGADAVLASLKRLAATPRYSSEFGDVNALQPRPPLPYYRISIADIAKGGGMENVQDFPNPVFYYPIESSGKLVTGAMLKTSPTGEMGAGLDLSRATTNVLLDQLAANDQMSAGSYEVRILNIPFAYGTSNSNFAVIWLKADVGGTDLIYGPASKTNSNGTLYNAADYLQSILPPAK